jgi:hypothetical protein
MFPIPSRATRSSAKKVKPTHGLNPQEEADLFRRYTMLRIPHRAPLLETIRGTLINGPELADHIAAEVRCPLFVSRVVINVIDAQFKRIRRARRKKEALYLPCQEVAVTVEYAREVLKRETSQWAGARRHTCG